MNSYAVIENVDELVCGENGQRGNERINAPTDRPKLKEQRVVRNDPMHLHSRIKPSRTDLCCVLVFNAQTKATSSRVKF